MRMAETSPATRRALLAACGGALLGLFPSVGTAQVAWPTKPVRMIVPFAPGASVDLIARIVAPRLAARLGAPVVVENRAGAGGMTGAAYVAGQAPDGHTLLFSANPFVLAPLLLPASQRPLYDPAKDLLPIAQVAAAPLMVVVSNDFPATTLRELIAAAAAAPQSITYGSGGVGSINHLGTEMLAAMARVQFMHVPYTGIGPAMAALLGGHLQMIVAAFPSGLPLVREGRVRALAVTSPQRSPLLPDLPTVAEAAVPGYELEAWWGVFGPASMPAPLAAQLNGHVRGLLSDREVVEPLGRDGAAPRPGGVQDFGDLIQAEIPRWRRLIREANITA